MAQVILLTPQTVTPGTCYPPDLQSLINLVAANIVATFPGSASTFVFGFTTPTPDQQSLPWIRTDSTGTIIGIYTFVGGIWVPGSTGSDKTGDIKSFSGNENNIIDPWFICNGQTVVRGYGSLTVPDYRGRTLIGTGSGSGLTARAQGDIGGEENHTLVPAEVPNLTMPFSNVAGGAGAVNLLNFAGTNNAPFTTTTNTGNGAHNNMQPFGAACWQMFVKPG